MGQGESSQLPFDIGEEDVSYNHPVWQLYNGKSKENNKEVSIFVYKQNKDNIKYKALAINALKYLKTLRLPYIVEYIAGHEFEQSIYIATEKVKPYQSLSTLEANLLALNIYNLIQAVSWLNNEAGMIHGNINPSALFIAQDGQLKLAGLEYIYKANTNIPLHVRNFQFLQHKLYQCPNKLNQQWNIIEELSNSQYSYKQKEY